MQCIVGIHKSKRSVGCPRHRWGDNIKMNACYHLVENLLSSSLLSKNLVVKIYGTIILPVVLYGCETWSLTLREEHRLRVC